LAIDLVAHIARDAGQRRITELLMVRRYDAESDRFEVEHCILTTILGGDHASSITAQNARMCATHGRRFVSTNCGRSTPTTPSGETSFLSGLWSGTLTITRTGEPDVSGA